MWQSEKIASSGIIPIRARTKRVGEALNLDRPQQQPSTKRPKLALQQRPLFSHPNESESQSVWHAQEYYGSMVSQWSHNEAIFSKNDHPEWDAPNSLDSVGAAYWDEESFSVDDYMHLDCLNNNNNNRFNPSSEQSTGYAHGYASSPMASAMHQMTGYCSQPWSSECWGCSVTDASFYGAPPPERTATRPSSHWQHHGYSHSHGPSQNEVIDRPYSWPRQSGTSFYLEYPQVVQAPPAPEALAFTSETASAVCRIGWKNDRARPSYPYGDRESNGEFLGHSWERASSSRRSRRNAATSRNGNSKNNSNSTSCSKLPRVNALFNETLALAISGIPRNCSSPETMEAFRTMPLLQKCCLTVSDVQQICGLSQNDCLNYHIKGVCNYEKCRRNHRLITIPSSEGVQRIASGLANAIASQRCQSR